MLSNLRILPAVLPRHVLRVCTPCMWLGMAMLQAYVRLAAHPSTSNIFPEWSVSLNQPIVVLPVRFGGVHGRRDGSKLG